MELLVATEDEPAAAGNAQAVWNFAYRMLGLVDQL